MTPEKPFAWSFSKLKSFEDCPRRCYEVDIKKAWPQEESAQLKRGKETHAALANALRGTPLPTKFKILQKWVDKVLEHEGELLVEDDCQWAITKTFEPTPWFAKNVWLRCIADAVRFHPTKPAALIIDWKDGKSSNVDPMQLTLTSLMLLIQFPKIQAVRSDFVWINEDYQTTQSLYRSDAANHWALLLPRIERLQEAVMEEDFPPQPGRFCKSWCPVKSCEYHGR
jgi:hypothetical protein